MYINLTLSVKNKKDAFVSKAPFTLMNKQVKNKSKQGDAKTTKSLSTGPGKGKPNNYTQEESNIIQCCSDILLS